MMTPSDIDPKVKIRSLTVKEVKELAMTDFDKVGAMGYMNNLIFKCSSLSLLHPNIVGGLIRDVLKISDIEISEETEKDLERINSLGRTYPRIFGDSPEKPELKEEAIDLYNKLIDEIQPNITEMNKGFFKIFKDTHIQPSELDKLPYWEYKQYLRML
jgi:hypothetical protein